jgi:hypothetical protein
VSGIFQVVNEFEGGKLLLLLYLISLGYLLLRERDKNRRILLCYFPLICLIVFFCPPVYKVYGKIESIRTYYRLLWLLPMSVTTIYTGLKIMVGNIQMGMVVMCGLFVLSGSFVYENENILKAENRLHLPQMILDISDYLMNETNGEETMAAMPEELVQFVRQYNTKILMPYGRDMQMGAYYNEVFDAMEQTDPVNADKLCAALEDYNCEFLVIEDDREIDGSLEENGLELLGDVDGYHIWHCPYAQNYRDKIAEYYEE